MYFKQQPTREDGSGGESYLYRVDITGFNEKRMFTPSFASDPAWSPRLPDGEIKPCLREMSSNGGKMIFWAINKIVKNYLST